MLAVLPLKLALQRCSPALKISAGRVQYAFVGGKGFIGALAHLRRIGRPPSQSRSRLVRLACVGSCGEVRVHCASAPSQTGINWWTSLKPPNSFKKQGADRLPPPQLKQPTYYKVLTVLYSTSTSK